MNLGLFGKLPAKRDYISHGVDRQFLELWEPWVQGAIAASRDQMRDGWLPAYMNAPIWRFWLGASLCGETVAGAVMPSVDGVGRYFPLSLIAKGIDMAPPPLDAQDAWYDAAEHVLLDALEEGREFETTLEALRAMPRPALPTPRSTEAAFAAIRHEAEPDFHTTLSCWWVRPHPGGEVRAMMRRGMPGPYDFIEMIRPVEPPPPVTEAEPEPLALTAALMQPATDAGVWDADPAEEEAPLDLTDPVGVAEEHAEGRADGEAAGEEAEAETGGEDTPDSGQEAAPDEAAAEEGGDEGEQDSAEEDETKEPADETATSDAEPGEEDDDSGALPLQSDMAVKSDV